MIVVAWIFLQITMLCKIFSKELIWQRFGKDFPVSPGKTIFFVTPFIPHVIHLNRFGEEDQSMF
jgi:hypothetical protein